jgi:hypothetical protein
VSFYKTGEKFHGNYLIVGLYLYFRAVCYEKYGGVIRRLYLIGISAPTADPFNSHFKRNSFKKSPYIFNRAKKEKRKKKYQYALKRKKEKACCFHPL